MKQQLEEFLELRLNKGRNNCFYRRNNIKNIRRKKERYIRLYIKTRNNDFFL